MEYLELVIYFYSKYNLIEKYLSNGILKNISLIIVLNNTIFLRFDFLITLYTNLPQFKVEFVKTPNLIKP